MGQRREEEPQQEKEKSQKQEQEHEEQEPFKLRHKALAKRRNSVLEQDAVADSGRDRLIDGWYLPLLLSTTDFSVRGRRFKLPLCAWATVLLLGAFAVAMLASAAQLKSPTEVEQWFPKDHMFEETQVQIRNNFMVGDASEYVDVAVIFGLAGIHRDQFDMFDSNQERGTPLFDPAMDMSLQTTQTASGTPRETD